MMYDYLFTFKNSYVIETNDPINFIWDYFRKISDIPYLNKKWPESSVETNIKVSTYIKQAYEYKTTSQNASLLTKPVLTYYSLHNLTKAVLLLRSISTDTTFHGLCKCQPNDSLIDGNVTTNNGVFDGLCKAFGYEYKIGEVLTIKDLLANTIEGNNFLIEYFEQKGSFIKIDWHGTYDGYIKNNLYNWKQVAVDHDDLEAKLKEFSSIFTDYDLKEEDDMMYLITKEKVNHSDFNKVANSLSQKYFYQNVFDQSPCWIKLLPNNLKYDPAIAYYTLLFIFSSYSRYHPEWLIKNILNTESGYEFMIDKLIQYSERIFPNLCMNLIRGIKCIMK